MAATLGQFAHGKHAMATIRNGAVLIGSLRRDSLNRKIANALIAIAPAGLKLVEAPIRDLPLYNADLDDNPPPAWTAFRDQIRPADAVLFVTPEYNRCRARSRTRSTSARARTGKACGAESRAA
jgi:hypothetical protein